MTYSIEDQINFEATKNSKDTTLFELLVRAEEQVESQIGSEEMKNYPTMLFEAQAIAFWMVNKGFHLRHLEEQVKHMSADVEKMRELVLRLKGIDIADLEEDS